MKYPILKLLLSIVVFVSACGIRVPLSEQAVSTTSLQAALDSIYQANPNAVGIMAHIEAPNQNLSWSGASGLANRDSKEELEADMPALIASNTKTYVSAAILRLVELGEIQLDQPIGDLLPIRHKTLLINDGYNLEEITVAHLLSHTSGVFDYVNAPSFLFKLEKNPDYLWSQDEQIALAMSEGEPLGKAGNQFSYADTNYLLLAAIIAEQTAKPYYIGIRTLLEYEKNGLNATWFDFMEPAPSSVKPIVHQYDGVYHSTNFTLHRSFDLYGGGGIAATTKDLARFSQLLFNGKFFEQEQTLNLIYTRVLDESLEDPKYYLGITESEINGHLAYGHGGFWGTIVQYLPELDASISVYILEKKEEKLLKDVLEALVSKIDKN